MFYSKKNNFYLIKVLLIIFLSFSNLNASEISKVTDKKIKIETLYNNFYYISKSELNNKDYVIVSFLPDINLWKTETQNARYYRINKYLDYKITANKNILLKLSNEYNESRVEKHYFTNKNFIIWTRNVADFNLLSHLRGWYSGTCELPSTRFVRAFQGGQR